MKTLQERLIVGLLKYGETEVKRLRGCVVFTRKNVPGQFFYIGARGSLRVGTTRSTSIPVSKQAYANLLTGGPLGAS